MGETGGELPSAGSIYEEFEFVGALGGGHPDPTVGFAEGQFYLITQQSTDHVSPGPWILILIHKFDRMLGSLVGGSHVFIGLAK